MTRLRQELLVGPTLLITLILCIVGREMLEVDSQGVDDSPFFGDLRSSAGVEMGCAAKMASNGFTVRVSMGILFSDNPWVFYFQTKPHVYAVFPSVGKYVVFTSVLRIHIIHVCVYIRIYTLSNIYI
jgi:hypothetical protein